MESRGRMFPTSPRDEPFVAAGSRLLGIALKAHLSEIAGILEGGHNHSPYALSASRSIPRWVALVLFPIRNLMELSGLDGWQQ